MFNVCLICANSLCLFIKCKTLWAQKKLLKGAIHNHIYFINMMQVVEL